jgi:UDP-N-acetylmuramate--alanine ligase
MSTTSVSPRYYFCGIGGAGMSPLARLLAARGNSVVGSDRSFDAGRNADFFRELRSEGISLVPQDGSYVSSDITHFVFTRAVEDSIPDIRIAKELSLHLIKRPLLMAEIFKCTDNIAVGGTSGKSTTTGMIAHILNTLGRAPTVMNGAVMLNFNSNFLNGDGGIAVFEADESDGHDDVVACCPAEIAVLTNVSLDHFSLDELHDIFGGFVSKAHRGAVLSADCELSMGLKDLNPRSITFGISEVADYSISRYPVQLSIPGEHNKVNALAAIAACSLYGIEPAEAMEVLRSFKGIKRRLELVGEGQGVRVIDDFASNPGKIAASLSTVISGAQRVFAVFQPHGFAPTKMMKQGYIDTFKGVLRAQDVLVMPDIYFAGGTANVVNGELVMLPKDISSNDIVSGVIAAGKQSVYIPERKDIVGFIGKQAKEGDVVLVMGSRDETLSDFALELLQGLSS